MLLGAMLLCTVRGCRLPLAEERQEAAGLLGARRLVCPAGHSFDRASEGYVNLLQPQDRRSRNPGDSKAAVQARRRLHEQGVGRALYEGVAHQLQPKEGQTLLDVGCGEGFHAGSLARDFRVDAHGVDLSAHAIRAAAKRYRECGWVVANADRMLPYADARFDLLLSITARLHPDEFRRVLRPDGRVLVAVPAPDDLQELRGVSARDPQATPKPGPDRVPRVLQEMAKHFRLTSQQRLTVREHLGATAVADLLLTIYRPHRAKAPAAMTLTFSLDVLLFEIIAPDSGNRTT
jgi:23S rRNA (guanine745-N1)-methyltransferase